MFCIVNIECVGDLERKKSVKNQISPPIIQFRLNQDIKC